MTYKSTPDYDDEPEFRTYAQAMVAKEFSRHDEKAVQAVLDVAAQLQQYRA